MLESLSNKLKGWAKGWLVFILFLLDGFFMAFVMPMLGALMQGDSRELIGCRAPMQRDPSLS